MRLWPRKKLQQRTPADTTNQEPPAETVSQEGPVDAISQQTPDELVNLLLAIAEKEGALLDRRGTELRARLQRIGAALHEAGGKDLMLEVHAEIRQKLGPTRARELEAAWDGVGNWLG